MARAAAHRWHQRHRQRLEQAGRECGNACTEPQKPQRQKAFKNNMALSCSLYPPAVLAWGLKIKIKLGNPLAKGAKKIFFLEADRCCAQQRPRGHAFLDKYRPRAPGGLQLQWPGKGETESLRVPAKGSGHVVRPAGARGCHAAQRRAVRAGGGSPPDGLTRTDRQAGNVRKSLPRGHSARFALPFFFFFCFFLFFSFFFFKGF